MINNKDDAAITRAVIDLAKALSLTTLAEGVESQAQFEMLKKFGCERAQGYLFGKPMIASEFESYCTQQIPCDDLYNDFVI
jgi:EAL domain-containing protein (putative c-di-GMP-specific phosphodiesterase class I)